MNQIVFEVGTAMWRVYAESRQHYPSPSLPPARPYIYCNQEDDQQMSRETRRESMLIKRHHRSKSSWSKHTNSRRKPKKAADSKSRLKSKSKLAPKPGTKIQRNHRQIPSLQQSTSVSSCSEFAIEEEIDRPLTQCFDLNTINIPSTTIHSTVVSKRRPNVAPPKTDKVT